MVVNNADLIDIKNKLKHINVDLVSLNSYENRDHNLQNIKGFIMSRIPTELSESHGKNISDLCPFSIAEDSRQNHCAHYVSHMMGYELPGATCKNFTWDDRQREENGATLRVDDVFKSSPETDAWADKPATVKECLIFVTLSSNVRNFGGKLQMGNHPRKHIGIFTNGEVWHYSNTNNRVVCHSLEHFKNTFRSVYATSGSTVEFYYGRFL
ncbi:hypothetical protein DN062_06165 [Nitrincola tibetensis]|uniref:Uncharacterized protein n=2 Tax=Nitrincola tibetensis TaxID=2219697 RepID=A0A364NPU7_9GAMM|nr:hypothetical protein DN062_06165 [Nitrincola tibetensis]